MYRVVAKGLMIKTPTFTENPKSNLTTHKRPPPQSDYTTIADRRRTVSWSNNSHPTGVDKPVPNLPTNHTSPVIKRKHI